MISSNAVANLVVYEGASFSQTFAWNLLHPDTPLDTEGNPILPIDYVKYPPTPVDLTNMTAVMEARDFIGDAEPVWRLTTENGGIVIESPKTDGKYSLVLTWQQTAGKCVTHEKRSLTYDVFFYSGNEAGLQQKGKINIFPSVTRRTP